MEYKQQVLVLHYNHLPLWGYNSCRQFQQVSKSVTFLHATRAFRDSNICILRVMNHLSVRENRTAVSSCDAVHIKTEKQQQLACLYNTDQRVKHMLQHVCMLSVVLCMLHCVKYANAFIYLLVLDCDKQGFHIMIKVVMDAQNAQNKQHALMIICP